MITASVKITLLFLSCFTLYITRYLPGAKVWWQGLTQRKFDVFLFCLLFISVTFLVGQRSAGAEGIVDASRAIRIVVIIAVIMLSWWRILTTTAKVRSIPTSVAFMLIYAVVAFLTASYSVFPSLTVWKSIEVFAHVSLAIMLARNTKTLEDASIVINLALLGLLFLVIETFWSALLFPGLAFQKSLHFTGMAGIYPKLNLNTAAQVGSSMGIGALATMFTVKSAAGRAVLATITVSGLALLLLAHSRTSILAFGACIIVFVLYTRSRMLKMMAIIGVVVGTIASTAVMTFLYRGQTQEQLENLSGRLDFWRLVMEKVMESPVFGYGYYSSARVLFNAPGADNTYLTVLLGGGIVLLSIFMIPIAIGSYHIYLSRPSKSWERSAGFYTALWMQVAGLFTILLIRSLTGPSFDSHHISLMLYLLTLIGAECLYRNRNNTAVLTMPGQPEPVYDKPTPVNSRILRRRRREGN